MSEIAERYRRVADGFGARVDAVPAPAWENRAPCEGWVARDVVRHLVEWVPAFFDAAGAPAMSAGPTADDDPAGAWHHLDGALQSFVDDPTVAAMTITHPYAGTHRLDDAVATFVLGDVLVHTWDLARAAGLDETLDAETVHDMLVGLEPMDQLLRESGQYGARVAVPDDAGEQTKLIAFTGRDPFWRPPEVATGARSGT
jgi:uncharacterized protein (TIGR03086 family)